MHEFGKRRHKRAPLLLSFTLFCLMAGVIWVRTVVVKETYHFVRQEKLHHLFQEEIQGLRLQWVRLTDNRKLQLMAERLGLVPPNPGQRFRYRTQKTKKDSPDLDSLKSASNLGQS